VLAQAVALGRRGSPDSPGWLDQRQTAFSDCRPVSAGRRPFC